MSATPSSSRAEPTSTGGVRGRSVGAILTSGSILLALAACQAGGSGKTEMIVDLADELPAAQLQVDRGWRRDFSPGETRTAILGPRWRSDHPSGHWRTSTGETATLTFSWQIPRPTRLRFRAVEPQCGRGPQAVTISLNDRELGSVRLTREHRRYALDVPADALRPGENRLGLHHGYLCPRDDRGAVWDWIALELPGEDTVETPTKTEAEDGTAVLELPEGTAVVYVLDLPEDSVLVWDRLDGTRRDRAPEGSGASLRIDLDPAGRSDTARIDEEIRADGEPAELPLSGISGLAELRLRAVDGGIRISAPRIVGFPGARPEREVPLARNAILISIDTLRADHLEVYGYPRPTSPSLTRFRDDAVLFRRAFAHAPSTFVSHASLFTSLIPQHHGASFARRAELGPGNLTVAELLSESGWKTAAFTGGGKMDPAFGLAQGYDVYDTTSGHSHFRDVVVKGLDWLEEHGPRRFFLFLHTYEAHHPYDPPAELLSLFEEGYSGPLPDEIGIELIQRINAGEVALDDEDLVHIVATYDALIRSMDRAFGHLVRELEKRGLYRDTVIVFTSDHGEEFGEHGHVGWHSHTLYDELLHVPLLVKMPRGHRGGTTVDGQVRLIDVAPTLLDLLGIPSPPEFTGKSLVPSALGERTRPEPLVGALDAPRRVAAIRHDGWKWYDGRLFDVEGGSREAVDLSDRHPKRARHLEELLEEIEARRTAVESRPAEVDSETLEQLRALGYVD